jgi:hypothetical protein
VTNLYTKNGKPLIVHGDDIFDSTGRQVGRRRGDKIYGPDGRYAGTIAGDRVVYRVSNSGTMGSAFAPRLVGGTGRAHRAAVGIWGDEPFTSTD